MRGTSCFIAALAFASMLFALPGVARSEEDSPWKDVPREQALRVLLAEARAQLRATTFVSYRDVMEWEDGSRRTSQWSFRGHPASGCAKMQRVAADGRVDRVEIHRDGKVYTVEQPLPGRAWTSRLREEESRRIQTLGVTGAMVSPLPAEVDGWSWSLSEFPIMSARSRGDEMLVQFASSTEVEATITSGELVDFLSGALGYQVLLRKIGGSYRPERIDFLQRSKIPGEVDGKTVVSWKDSRRQIKDFGTVDFAGIECGVWMRYELSGYRAVGEDVWLPMKLKQYVFNGENASGHVVAETLEFGTEPEGALEFKAPTSFGRHGVHHDDITGETVLFGDPSLEEETIVPSLLRGGDALRQRLVGPSQSSSEPAWALWGAWAAVLLALVGWSRLRHLRSRGRVCVESPAS